MEIGGLGVLFVCLFISLAQVRLGYIGKWVDPLGLGNAGIGLSG